MAEDVLQACLFAARGDLLEVADVFDERVAEAAWQARVDLYEERTGKPYPTDR